MNLLDDPDAAFAIRSVDKILRGNFNELRNQLTGHGHGGEE